MGASSHPTTGCTSHPWFVLAAAFLVGLLVVGLPYWRIPYANVSLPSSLSGSGLLVLAGMALALVAWYCMRVSTVILVIGGVVPVVVFARIVEDATRDSTTHNLWPVELVIAMAMGFVLSAAGALAGRLIAHMRSGDQRRM